jgi:DNA-binding XRE family transcriptional regulator/predicted RNase H-like HicB family nuclease
MTIAYPVRFEADGDAISAQGLPPFTGVITYGHTLDEARFNAGEALTLEIQCRLDEGAEIPKPQMVDAPGVEMIEPDAVVTVPIQLRWAREAAGLTQGYLAGRLGISYQSIQNLERSGANPSIKTLAKVSRALGRRLTVAI